MTKSQASIWWGKRLFFIGLLIIVIGSPIGWFFHVIELMPGSKEINLFIIPGIGYFLVLVSFVFASSSCNMNVQTYLKEEAVRKGAAMRRFRVLGIGILVGMVFALVMALTIPPISTSFKDRLLAWATVMGGPFVGTSLFDLHVRYPMSMLPGWLGLLLIPVHPVRPRGGGMAFVTLLGFALWYYAGFWSLVWLCNAG